MQKNAMQTSALTGDQLLRVLAALSNPQRMRVVVALAGKRNYVSQLARELQISRALLQVHLRKLESAGLVVSALELSDDGKAMKYYELVSFVLDLTPETLTAAVRTLTVPSDGLPDTQKGSSDG